mgnify:CR=1 FL=1
MRGGASRKALRTSTGKVARHAKASESFASAPLPWAASSYRATWIGLVVADILSVLAAAFATGSTSAGSWAMAAIWVVLRAMVGLYDPISMAPAEDLRRSTQTTFAVFVGHFAAVLLLGRLVAALDSLLPFWGILFVLPWFARQVTRRCLVSAKLHGAPLAVLGAGAPAEALISELHQNPDQGLFPVAVFDDDRSLRGTRIFGVPVVGTLSEATEYPFQHPVRHALVALAPNEIDQLRDVGAKLTAKFRHVHVTPEFVDLANLWVRSRAIGPLATLEFRQDSVSAPALLIKRWFDAALGFAFLLAAAPLIAVCALLVKLVSPGPVFFSQVREGHRGRLVRVWKIRTMVPDAEDRLAKHLDQNSSAKREWAERVKLDYDPRVIPALGTFLRRWSLDELPQLWNVVTGSMSLVGPRPFPEYHLSLFPNDFRELRRNVPPGVTGLWQVTYRADGDLSHQQAADSYYVRNRSIWLDLWILLRTVRVVFAGSGT